MQLSSSKTEKICKVLGHLFKCNFSIEGPLLKQDHFIFMFKNSGRNFETKTDIFMKND